MSGKNDRRAVGWFVCLLLLAAMILISGVASAGTAAYNVAVPQDLFTVQVGGQSYFARTVFAPLSAPAAGAGQRVQVMDLSEELYVVDLPSMGVHAIPGERPHKTYPDSGAVGLLGAFMSVSPDVISQSIPSGFGAASANWTPGEMVAVSLNGGAPTDYVASGTGRLGQIFNVGSGLGYITIEARGLTSGRQTGGVVEVRDAAPPVPGLAISPHAINPNGSSNINVLGTRYIANSSITLARNGTAINTLTSGANGSFYYQINVAAGADTSAIYSTYTTTIGSRTGQSIEERADAGVPPIGDQNITRAFIDRPVVSSAGGTVALVGEGFLTGETVNVTGCGSLSAVADSNGAVRFFNGISGSGVFNCVLSGGITGRVGRASGIGATNAINAPGAIAAPAAVAGTGTFTFIVDRLLPNQSGSVYVDNVSQGNLSTDASGKAAALVNKPASGFLHIVEWAGASGQRVGAPLLYLPAGGTPTPTRTITRTPTRTPTNPPTNTPTLTPTNTPTWTPTNTPTDTPTWTPTDTPTWTPTDTPTWTPTNTPLPTQTQGGFTATPVPTNTRTNTPTRTPTGTPTRTPTRTPSRTVTRTRTPTRTSTNTPLPTQTQGGFTATPMPTDTAVPTDTPELASPTPTHCPLEFTDVLPGSTFYSNIRCLVCLGIVSGYNTSPPCITGIPCFLPGNDVTRGQMAKFVSNAAGYTDLIPANQQTFMDVPPNSTFWLYVERAYLHDVVGGYTTSPPCVTGTPCFLPGNSVTRGQIAKFVSNAASYSDVIPPDRQTFTDVEPSSTFWVFVERVYQHGVISGYTASPPCTTDVPCFIPGNNVTRGQTAKFISNAFFPDCDTPLRR